ncbi:MAG: hypothetical protein ACREMY_05220, partial [bacterium]
MSLFNRGKAGQQSATSRSARMAVLLLVAINLFNYVDRQVLAAVVPDIRSALFGSGQSVHHGVTGFLIGLLQPFLGKNPENAMIGLLAMAFMLTYMV